MHCLKFKECIYALFQVRILYMHYFKLKGYVYVLFNV